MKIRITEQLKSLNPINSVKVREFLKCKGIKNTEQMPYHFTIMALAKLIVKDIQNR